MLSPTLVTWLLFATTACIWGSTWLAIQFQLGVVPPMWSIAYRFIIASALLLIGCRIAGLPLRFPWRTHVLFLSLGVILFGLNYILFYFGSTYFISGLVAIIFASILPLNILQARLFFATPFTVYVILGSLLGLLGLAMISWTQIKTFYLHAQYDSSHVIFGLMLCLLGTYTSSSGQMIAASLGRRQIPIIQTNAWGMLYGATFITLAALLSHEVPTFDMSFSYIASLLYLSLFGTVIAFVAYFYLINRIGPDRAAYALLITPLIAMVLSSWQEGFVWDIWVLLGTGLILWGNLWVLKKQ